jgi:transcriptional regulator with XRE-family HTH domain
MSAILETTIKKLDRRRKRLKMSMDVLAKRSGVPLATVKRMFALKVSPSFIRIAAVAEALGGGVRVKLVPEDEVINKQVGRQADRLVGMVQGTMGLESQAVDSDAVKRMVETTSGRLRAGPRRKLWDES